MRSRTAEKTPVVWISERHPPDTGGMAVSSGRLVNGLRDRGRSVVTLHLRGTRGDFFLGDDPLSWIAEGWQSDPESLFFSRREQMAGKILVGFGGGYPGYLAALWGRWLGARSLALFRGNDLDRLVHDRERGWLVWKSLETADSVGAVTTEMCGRVRTMTTSPVHFTPIGIIPEEWSIFPADHEAAAELRRRHVPSGAPLVGLFGHLKRKKGLDIAMTVFDRYGLGKIATLLTVGDIPESALAAHGDEHTFWRREPFRPREELVPCYLACDIVFIPSLHDGMPNVLLEAMLLGRMVVAARCGGMADVVDHGVNGFLFPPGDPVAAAETLARVLSLPEQERGRIGREAKARALDFSCSREVDIIETILDSLGQGHEP